MNLSRSSTTLFVSSPSALDSVMATVAEPDDERRRRLGTFFVLVKVDEIATLLPWLIPFTQYLEQSFYQTLESEPEISVDRALGIIRQRAKLKLQQVTAETRTITMDAVHYCFGTLKGKTLSLSHVGDIHAFLLHRRLMGTEDRGAQWIDITGTPMRQRGATRPIAVGTPTIVSGVVGDHDTIVITTESIIETMGLSKLERVLSSASLEGAKTLLERDLRNTGNRLTFGALFIRRPLLPAETRNREVVTNSMATLMKRESGTAELLTPQSPSPLKRLWQAGKSVSRERREPRASAAPTPAPEPTIHLSPRARSERSWGMTLGALVRMAINAIGRGIIRLAVTPVRLLAALASPEQRKQVLSFIAQWPESSTSSIMERLRRLPRSSQRLLIVAFVFAFLFMQSLVFLAGRQSRNVLSSQEDQLVQSIQDALDQADSNVIFHNDSAAGQLLAQASAELANLHPSSATDIERQRLLTARLDDIKTRLMHLTTVQNPQPLVSLTDNRFQTADSLVRVPQGLLLVDGTRNAFAVAAETDGKLDIRTIDATGIGNVQRSVLNEQNQAAFLTHTPGVATLDLTANTLKGTTITNASRSAVALAFYHSRLYLLDPANAQIWRHQLSSNTYQAGVPWAKGNADDLSNATDLAIDGEVYVLLKNGEVVKFLNGQEENWQGTAPIDVATSASRLLVPSDVPLLFAMDSASKRIFVWNKNTGELMHQFAFPTLSNLADFALGDKGQTLFLLSGNAVYRAPIDLTAK